MYALSNRQATHCMQRSMPNVSPCMSVYQGTPASGGLHDKVFVPQKICALQAAPTLNQMAAETNCTGILPRHNTTPPLSLKKSYLHCGTPVRSPGFPWTHGLSGLFWALLGNSGAELPLAYLSGASSETAGSLEILCKKLYERTKHS